MWMFLKEEFFYFFTVKKDSRNRHNFHVSKASMIYPEQNRYDIYFRNTKKAMKNDFSLFTAFDLIISFLQGFQLFHDPRGPLGINHHIFLGKFTDFWPQYLIYPPI